MLTAQPTVEKAVLAMRMGADDYLAKPFSQEDFQLSVRRALDRRKVHLSRQSTEDLLNLTSICQVIASTLDRRKVESVVGSFLARLLRVADWALYLSA